MRHTVKRISGEDRGSSTAYALVVLLLVLVLASMLGAVGVGLAVRQQIQRGADITALAAAGLHSTTPCRDAQQVAAAHRLQVVHCRWEAGRAEVTVVRHLPGIGPVAITARAGLTAP